MKYKLKILSLLTAIFMLTACSASQESFPTSTQLDTVETSTTATTEFVRHQINPITFPSITDLVNSSDIIIVGAVVNSSINRIDLASEGYVNVEGELFTNVSSFNIDVFKIIKGSVPSNMKLKVDLRCGGEVNGYYEIYEPAIPSPSVGDKCIFFIDKPEKFNGREYFEYKFEGTFDGFVKIENGKIIPPQDKHSVFIETTYDSLIKEIKIDVDITGSAMSGVYSADEVNFPDSVNYVLLEGMTDGEFDLYLGMGGGIPLYNVAGAMCGCLEIHLYGSSIFEDDELVGVKQFANHAWFASEFIPVSSSVPCVAVKYSQSVYDEETGQYTGERELWYAFWAKEGFEPLYAIYLYADSYDFEDLKAIAESVTFSADAFVTQ